MHHTLQVPPAVGCCHLTFCMWLQVPVGFFRIPAPPSAFSSHACLLHREFLSALLLLPHRSECYCLLLGASLMVGVERSCPFGLVSVLCRPSEAVISHCSCQPPPPMSTKLHLVWGKTCLERERVLCPALSGKRYQSRAPWPSRVAKRACFYSSKSSGYLPGPRDRGRGQKSFLLSLRGLRHFASYEIRLQGSGWVSCLGDTEKGSLRSQFLSGSPS